MDRKQFLRRAAAGVGAVAVGYTAFGKALEKGRRYIDPSAPYRSVSQVIPAVTAKPAPTLTVKRTLPFGRQNYILDPFVMLDHFGPRTVKPGQGIGVNPHPHRGFEPVTFMFEGHVEHRDSLGNTGLLHRGGCQWMTSGRGIIHAEDMCKLYSKEGGILHGVQLWVNLPAKDKMADPGYQNIQATDMPVLKQDEGKARIKVVAGDFFGTKGPAKTFTPIQAFMIELDPGASVEIPAPETHNAFIQLLTGNLMVKGEVVSGSNLILYVNDGDKVIAKADPNAKEKAELLFLSGEPINEPVFSYGPFVMNSREEINAAFADYQSGKMGTLE